MLDRVGPYQITGELGRGGMGVVYRATDERLGRTVAIKALPEELAQDPSRLERFEREARTLASLNHPNLAAIYGVEEQNGDQFLVLEFVDGETLAEWLDRGALDLDDAISLAMQIAAGVEAAHEAGIIHRDLKPANIKITPDGKAKVLDFGLAKAEEPSTSSTSVGPSALSSQSPTLTSAPSSFRSGPLSKRSSTMTGMILGTAAYMSPEQARGRPLDKRTDVWAFGVILFEMLTGSSPFIGESATDSIGAVLHKEIDFSRLPANTPAAVRRVLVRCLERDKSKRWRDLGDVQVELAHANESSEPITAAAPRNRAALAAGVLLVTIVGAAVGWGAGRLLGQSPATPIDPASITPPLIVDLAPPEGYLIERSSGPPRLSPDGTRLALVVRRRPEAPGESPGPGILCVKDLTTGTSTLFDQDDGIIFPTWSPDGKKILYGSNAVITLFNVNTARVESVIAATGGYPRGIEWSEGNISTAATINGLLRLDLNSGQTLDPLPILSADESGGGVTACPTIIDTDHYLYTLSTAGPLNGVYLATTSDHTQTRVLNYDDVQTRYLAGAPGQPGWLYFAHDGAIFRQQLDLAAKTMLGEPEMLADDAWTGHWPVSVPFDVGPEGRLVYYRDEAAAYDSELVIRNLDTSNEEHTGVTGSLFAPSFSADDRYIVLDLTSRTTEGDIVTIDRQRPGLPATVASDPTNETYPLWLGNDSSSIAYERDGDLFLAQRDGSRAPRPLLRAPEKLIPLDTTPDGASILYVDTVSAEGQPMYLLDVATGVPTRWLDVILRDAKICPDNRWIAVITGRPDRAQLELRHFPEGTGRIILDIGAELGSPVWSQDRTRLVYLKSGTLHSIDFSWPEPSSDPSAVPEPPTFTQPTQLMSEPIEWRSYDLNADGSELLYIKKIDQTTGESIRLVAADPPPTRAP